MKNEDKAVRQEYRIQLAGGDFQLAREIALHLLKKGWHDHEINRRGASRMQQTAYTTAFVVTYNRPFTSGHGWDRLPIGEVDLTPEERALHRELKDLRDQVHAHTDHEKHDQRVWSREEGGRQFVITTTPPYHLSKKQLETAVVIIDKLTLHFCPASRRETTR